MTSGGMLYGGDEIGALVIDPGHHSLRVGYAAHDAPTAELPSVVGVAPGDSAGTAASNAGLDVDLKARNNNITSKSHQILFCLQPFRWILGYKYVWR